MRRAGARCFAAAHFDTGTPETQVQGLLDEYTRLTAPLVADRPRPNPPRPHHALINAPVRSCSSPTPRRRIARLAGRPQPHRGRMAGRDRRLRRRRHAGRGKGRRTSSRAAIGPRSGPFIAGSEQPLPPRPPTRSSACPCPERGQGVELLPLAAARPRLVARTLRRDDLPPADLYHAFGILTLPVALDLAAAAPKRSEEPRRLRASSTPSLDSNNYTERAGRRGLALPAQGRPAGFDGSMRSSPSTRPLPTIASTSGPSASAPPSCSTASRDGRHRPNWPDLIRRRQDCRPSAESCSSSGSSGASAGSRSQPRRSPASRMRRWSCSARS